MKILRIINIISKNLIFQELRGTCKNLILARLTFLKIDPWRELFAELYVACLRIPRMREGDLSKFIPMDFTFWGLHIIQ